MTVALCVSLAGILAWVLSPPGGARPPSSANTRTPTSPNTSEAGGEITSASSSTAPTVPANVSDPLSAASAYVATRSGTVAVEVDDLKTGETWTLGSSTPQDEASIVKVDILEKLLAQSGGEAIPTSEDALAKSMIEESDNDAATDLWNIDGSGPGIAAFNAAIGLKSTQMSSCLTCPDFPWPGWGLSTTTPADQIALLKAIVLPNSHLNDGQREAALNLMQNVTPSERWGVTSGVSPQATVALKNGWLPLDDSDTDWQINSIGWVTGDGRDYLFAALTNGNPSEDYGITTIDQISADVWTALQ